MKKRIWITGIVFLVLSCCLLLWHRKREPQTETRPQDAAAEGRTVGSEKKTVPTNQMEDFVRNSLTNQLFQKTPSLGHSNAAYEKIIANWQAPIEFYGKVVDENSNAVAGARVSFYWFEEPTENGNRSATTQSDAAGLFLLQGARGPTLAVSVSKDGYYSSQEREHPVFRYGSFAGDDFSPDPRNPVVFHLKKKSASEPLVKWKHNYRIPLDGTAFEINLSTGEPAKAGMGDITIQCPTENPKEAGQKYNWHCRVAMLNGGVVRTDEEFPFLAPETGYTPAIEIDMPADAKEWADEARFKFYYHLADGRYGRISFSMIAHGQHFCIIDAIQNPSGSRNLEPP